jgi:hypothetical protein
MIQRKKERNVWRDGEQQEERRNICISTTAPTKA